MSADNDAKSGQLGANAGLCPRSLLTLNGRLKRYQFSSEPSPSSHSAYHRCTPALYTYGTVLDVKIKQASAYYGSF